MRCSTWSTRWCAQNDLDAALERTERTVLCKHEPNGAVTGRLELLVNPKAAVGGHPNLKDVSLGGVQLRPWCGRQPNPVRRRLLDTHADRGGRPARHREPHTPGGRPGRPRIPISRTGRADPPRPNHQPRWTFTDLLQCSTRPSVRTWTCGRR